MNTRQLKPVPPQEWPAVHHDMQQQAFPETPASYQEARAYFQQVDLYGVYVAQQRLATFILGPTKAEGAFLDVVCAPGLAGRWASRPVLREMADLAFRQRQLKYVWIQTHSSLALKAALQAGFRIISGCAADNPFLILTLGCFNQKLQKQNTSAYAAPINPEKMDIVV